MNTENFGFKKLTINNWLSPENVMVREVVDILPNGVLIPLTPENWILEILEFELLMIVPFEVRKLFAVAQGSIAYGYFFYPLLTLGSEQLYRVIEASVDHKCKELSRDKPKEKFACKIDWLIKKSVITGKDRWDSIRSIRNETSHPKSQTIISREMVLSDLKVVTECINSLFDNSISRNS